MSNNQNFWDHVKQNLTAHEWEKLPSCIGWSKTKFGRVISGVDDWQIEEVIKMAKLLKESPTDLILEYGLGTKSITIDQMNGLLQGEGCQVGRIQHAA